jgi:hypothetical protein
VRERLVVHPQLELVAVLHYRQRVPSDVEGVVEGPLVTAIGVNELLVKTYELFS